MGLLSNKITPIKLSTDGAAFIGNFEGFESLPYKDGGGLLTIGYGHRIPSADIYPNGITRTEAAALMQSDAAEVVRGLTNLQLDLPLQHHQDAVISLVYNIGMSAFSKSIIYEHLQVKAVDLWAWKLWTKDAKGVVEPGLVRRRNAEMTLFVWGLYD
jgi:lysozyme